MNDKEQARRQSARGREALATIGMALLMATVLALGAEALAQVLGLAAGQPGAHRGWADALLLGRALGGDPLPRDLLALAALLFPVCLLPARHVGPTLVARYDAAALRVEPAVPLAAQAGPESAGQHQAWAGIETWCLHGAGPGCGAWWRPGALPEVEQRLSVAVLTGGGAREASRLAEAFSRHIDGSLRLQALGGGLPGLRWRLRIKLDECLWWRPLPAGTPWDAGYLPLSEVALLALRRFSPRRATLIVADGLHPRLLAQALRTLEGRRAAFRHPVRLLVVADAPECLPPLQAAAPPLRTAGHAASPLRGAVPVFDLQAA
jgi:hypothetical protein